MSRAFAAALLAASLAGPARGDLVVPGPGPSPAQPSPEPEPPRPADPACGQLDPVALLGLAALGGAALLARRPARPVPRPAVA